MGVQSCGKNGCEYVMCDRYSPTYGYICEECFEELVNSGATTNIQDFMNSEKSKENKGEAKARYNYVFGRS